jgi:ubiquitin carboxyl-terminal hydrolase 9/24
VHEVLIEGLFRRPTATTTCGSAGPPKCKTNESRRCAFRLLLELAREHPGNFQAISAMLLDHIDQLGLSSEWSFSPAEFERSETGYVGLKNQGATCYANATLQQLFFI